MKERFESTDQPPQLTRALDALRAMRRRLEELERSRTEPIAIVGMGCRFPGGADDPESFWQLLRAGRDAVTDVPADRWDIDAYYDPDSEACGKICSRRGGFLASIDRFDAAFFGIAPREAASMDPQHRLALEVAWEALEHAAIAPASLTGSRTGVFVGISANDYLRLQAKSAPHETLEGHTLTGNALNAVAGRLSFFLGLHGPSMAVDTACSSSLVAVHLACQSLRSGECRLALAGGVNAILSPDMSIIASRAHMLSPDGRCKTFDASADGFVRSEGSGFIVMKRLSDALEDGDRVLALIRGSAVNQDGPSSGFTTPNGLAQQQLIRDALADAGLQPAQVGYVEAHGTGTALGDPVEARAIAAVYGQQRTADRTLWIGSVKTNLGHLESAAGMAGLIKAVLTLQNEEIPPHLHLCRINPEIQLDDIPAAIPTEPTPWQTDDEPRIAAVSSFGASGTNAHLVLEQAPPIKTTPNETRPAAHLLCLSARSESALRQLARRYAIHLEKTPDVSFADVCFTANTGRSHFAHRLALVAESAGQARDRLSSFASGEFAPGVLCGQCPADKRSTQTQPSPENTNSEQGLLAAARTYVEGDDVDFAAIHAGSTLRRLSLPTYPFERKRYWFDAVDVPASRYFRNDPGAHPLLGRRLRSALRDVPFESTLSPSIPSFLADHRVGAAVVFPATAYIEMALAAGAETFDEQSLELRDISIHQPLILHETAPRTVQLILRPDEGEAAEFEILSIASEDFQNQASWIRHASGSVRRATVDPSAAQNLSVESLRSRCPRAVSVDAYYRRLDQAGLSFGPSFRGLAELWVGQGETLARIVPHESIATETGPYRFHPAILDACFQTVGPLIQGDLLWPDAVYVATGVETLRHTRTTDGPLFSHAVRRHKNTNGTPESVTFDLTILSESGHVVAEIIGLRLQCTAAYREQSDPIADLDDLLYEVRWQQLPDAVEACPPTPREISERVHARLTASGARQEMAVYDELIPEMNALSVAYVVNALSDLGFAFQPGDRLSTQTLAERLGVVPRHHRLFHRLLEMLSESGLLRPVEAEWEVCREPASTNTEIHRARLLANHPACASEITLLSRCGQHLADVLRGHCDPLDLLFPDGSLTALEELYQNAPFARVGNRIVRESLAEILAAWPADRNIRILEIGAGTGGTTADLLNDLPADRTEYVFTDVSPLFLAHARKKFSRFPFVRYELLDIEQDPIRQSFEEHSFDIVIAANVLHATKDLRQTLAHVRNVSAAGAAVLLFEVTAPQRWADLTFGLTEGWWKFADTDLRPDYPLLPRARWVSLLAEAGFSDPVAIGSSDSRHEPFEQSVLLARTEPDAQIARPRHTGKGRWLIFADHSGVGAALAKRLQANGDKPLLVHVGQTYEHHEPDQWRIRPHHPEDFARVLHEVPDEPLANVVQLWPLDGAPAETATPAVTKHDRMQSCRSALHLAQALAGAAQTQPARLWVVTRGTQPVIADDDVIAPHEATLWGLGRVVATEHPEIWGGLLDLAPTAGPQESAECVFSALHASDGEDQLAYRNGHRYAARLVKKKEREVYQPPLSFRANATYLITGGLSGLGLVVARWMVECGARHVALMGRRDASESARQVIRELEKTSAKIRIFQGDVARADDVGRILAKIHADMPPLRGIIHSAGVLDDGVLVNQTWDRFETVFAPKVSGTWHLHQQTDDLPLDFFVLFSSAVSLLGSAGQANHAAANAFVDALARWRRAQGLPAVTMNWGAWGDVGTVVDRDVSGPFARQGIGIIPPARALAALEHSLVRELAQVCVLAVDWEKYLRQFPVGGGPSLFRDVPRNAPTLPETAPSLARDRFLVGLRETPPAKREEALHNHLREQVAQVLGLDPSEPIDPRRPLSELGLDSLLAIELRKSLGLSLGRALPATILFDCPTVDALSGYIGEKVLGFERPETSSSETRPNHEALAELADKLQAMPEPELEKLLLDKLNAIEERWIG